MKRKLLIVIYLCAFCLFTGTAQNQVKQTPNVVLIMADDVSWECFSCYGADDYQTPNIDKLAAEGVKFNHCYSTPLCTPSRVELMTGQYSFRNYTYFGYLNPNDKTIGNLMQDAGYKTAIAGKWQLNGLYHHAEGCTDNTRPYKAGFDEYCLWQLTRGARGENGGERFWSPLLESNGKMLSKQDNDQLYGPDIMSDFVCDFIDRNADSPFFVYYPSVLVHDPFVPTPDNIADGDRSHKGNNEPKEYDSKKENFVAMVAYLDKIVGKIVNKLDEVGQLENTIILFTADNGTNRRINSNWNGQVVHGGKGHTTNMGTHVPLIASWKGHGLEGVENNHLIDFSDFYATLAEAVNISVNDHPDSRSFYAQIMGNNSTPRDWQFLHYQPYWGNFQGRQYIRNQQYKLYRSGNFYDISDDMEEKNNLSGDLTKKDKRAYKKLNKALNEMPPAPEKKGGRNASNRPIYPDWQNVVNPND